VTVFGSSTGLDKANVQGKKIKLIGHTPMADLQLDRMARSVGARRRIFLLSPANISGERAKLVLADASRLPLAQRLKAEGASIGEVFSFISGLYFRGKLAYSRAYADPPPRIPGIVVITAGGGLVSPDRIVTMDELREISSAQVDANESRYRIPLERDARLLCEAMGEGCEAVLLGSIATPKYVEPLSGIFGARLLFPAEFVGRGDMSRGAMLLRCVREGTQLRYSQAITAETQDLGKGKHLPKRKRRYSE
jgi:hypothetical protein